MPDLLLELATEELPASYLDRALEALAGKANEPGIIARSLAEVALAPKSMKVAGTPRRLAVWCADLPARQADVVEEKQGPSEQAAFKDGQPTQAALKFAESLGLRVDEVKLAEVTKGKKTSRYLVGTKKVAGRATLEVLAELIPRWIEAIPFKKTMRWVKGEKTRFARPLRGICALFGGEVVPASWAGQAAGRTVLGHRFLVSQPLELASASWDDYAAKLRAAKVLVDKAERRRVIEAGLREHMTAEQVERWAHLVDEVANLVEWPLVDVANFDARYLRLPRIVIEEAMTGHQRYFPLEDKAQPGALQPRFAYVANRPFDLVIRAGNERVLAARLHDALFFFEQDQKTPLDQRVPGLDEIVFMAELGSYRARISRIDALALAVARAAGWAPEDAKTPNTGLRITSSVDRTSLYIHIAAQLARTDLTTDLVQEFPGLQGEMGAIYAALQGQPEEVSQAIREAYLPRGEGGAVPRTNVGAALALADKLDTIVCAWATDRKPTGSKDPFMVRRSVVGALRILRERALDLPYAPLVRAAIAELPKERQAPDLEQEILRYFRERLEVMGTDAGHRADHVRAVLDSGAEPTNVVDLWARLEALAELAKDERFGQLFALVERTKTITDKNGKDVKADDVDPAALEHPAEKALHQALAAARGPVRTLVDARRYVEAGRLYAERLADVVHTFFEPAPKGVFVMDEDRRKRTNRLALLKQVHALLAQGFADLALIAGKA